MREASQILKDIRAAKAAKSVAPEAIAMAKEVQALVALIDRIKAALGTEENGEALVEVARNAHRAEMELASTYNFGSLDDEG